jgi:hypothetical protein
MVFPFKIISPCDLLKPLRSLELSNNDPFSFDALLDGTVDATIL